MEINTSQRRNSIREHQNKQTISCQNLQTCVHHFFIFIPSFLSLDLFLYSNSHMSWCFLRMDVCFMPLSNCHKLPHRSRSRSGGNKGSFLNQKPPWRLINSAFLGFKSICFSYLNTPSRVQFPSFDCLSYVLMISAGPLSYRTEIIQTTPRSLGVSI